MIKIVQQFYIQFLVKKEKLFQMLQKINNKKYFLFKF